MSAENVSETLGDPSLVSVVGVVSADPKAMKSPQPVKNSTSTDASLEAMDQKWSECFSRLEALFLSKSMEKSDPTFQTLKMPAIRPLLPYLSSQTCQV